MTLDILICTFNAGVIDCDKILLPPHKNIRYKISHQITDSQYKCIPDNLARRSDVTISQIYCKGLSKNRNNVISMATEEICIIADDDVRYKLNDLLELLNLFNNNPQADIIAGKIRTYDGEGEYKNYSPRSHKIGISGIGSISSIEIAFRRDAIMSNKIQFNENFGIGGYLYPKGEESIFLKQCLDAKLKIWYYPIYVVQHPKLSSCSKIEYSSKEAEYMGALNWVLFNCISYLTLFVFTLKHYSRYRNHMSPITFAKSYVKGCKIMKSHIIS